MGTELVKFKMLKKRKKKKKGIDLRLLEINNQHKVVEERIKT